MTHKRHSAAFKAQVAIEALKEKETLAELAKTFDPAPLIAQTFNAMTQKTRRTVICKLLTPTVNPIWQDS